RRQRRRGLSGRAAPAARQRGRPTALRPAGQRPTGLGDHHDGGRPRGHQVGRVLRRDRAAAGVQRGDDDVLRRGREQCGIEYHYNEKMNALAPTITEQGATGVATQINETFAATLGEAGLNIVSTLSEYLNDADTQALLSRMEARV